MTSEADRYVALPDSGTVEAAASRRAVGSDDICCLASFLIVLQLFLLYCSGNLSWFVGTLTNYSGLLGILLVYLHGFCRVVRLQLLLRLCEVRIRLRELMPGRTQDDAVEDLLVFQERLLWARVTRRCGEALVLGAIHYTCGFGFVLEQIRACVDVALLWVVVFYSIVSPLICQAYNEVHRIHQDIDSVSGHVLKLKRKARNAASTVSQQLPRVESSLESRKGTLLLLAIVFVGEISVLQWLGRLPLLLAKLRDYAGLYALLFAFLCGSLTIGSWKLLVRLSELRDRLLAFLPNHSIHDHEHSHEYEREVMYARIAVWCGIPLLLLVLHYFGLLVVVLEQLWDCLAVLAACTVILSAMAAASLSRVHSEITRIHEDIDDLHNSEVPDATEDEGVVVQVVKQGVERVEKAVCSAFQRPEASIRLTSKEAGSRLQVVDEVEKAMEGELEEVLDASATCVPECSIFSWSR
eukprot:TRINITY_DN33950_c0_g1_i1.p1 TRINITY_DN33950_c0_g1~~TRINITY_DN33950_c0_g1_i1.p1  ORF type:complete len:467 (+),score=50.63 TRINITY_DN33950_c0_g1_i1:53-1453(+)